MSTTALEGTVVDHPKAVTIFGREPAVILSFVEAVVASLVVFPVGEALGLNETFVVVFMAFVTAAISLWVARATKDRLLGLTIGLFKAGLSLAAYWHFELSSDQQAMLIVLITAVFGFVQRTQTSPVAFPADPSPVQVTGSIVGTGDVTDTDITSGSANAAEHAQDDSFIDVPAMEDGNDHDPALDIEEDPNAPVQEPDLPADTGPQNEEPR